MPCISLETPPHAPSSLTNNIWMRPCSSHLIKRLQAPTIIGCDKPLWVCVFNCCSFSYARDGVSRAADLQICRLTMCNMEDPLAELQKKNLTESIHHCRASIRLTSLPCAGRKHRMGPTPTWTALFCPGLEMSPTGSPAEQTVFFSFMNSL